MDDLFSLPIGGKLVRLVPTLGLGALVDEYLDEYIYIDIFIV